MTIKTFQKKPVQIQAIQYIGVSNLLEVLKFTGKSPEWHKFFNSESDYVEWVKNDNEIMKIFTLEGTMNALPGDWIIKGVQGEFYPCKPEIFKATYEEVADEVHK